MTSKLVMNKKSQFYFFAAVVLIGLVFLVISSQPSITSKNNQNLQNLFENYNYEANVIINNALYENKNISSELRNYTSRFISYAKNKDINLGILYLYSYQNNTYIVNYLKEPVLIISLDLTIQNEQEIVTSYNTIQVVYSNETYTYRFTPNQIKFKSLFVKGD